MSHDELILDMTRKEAESLNNEIRASMGKSRIGVYLMHKRQGYKALGFKDFGDYCEQMIDTPRNTALDWVNQVQATCDALGFSVTNLLTMSTNEKGTLLPTTATRELRKLPSADSRRKVWEQMETFEAQGLRNPREMAISVKRLVSQFLKKQEPAPTTPPQSPETESMPAPSANTQEPATNAPEQAQERAKPSVTSFAPPAEKTQERDDAQDGFFEEDEPEPVLVKANARAVHRDDGLRCLIIEACLPDGSDLMLRVPYVLLPGDMQP